MEDTPTPTSVFRRFWGSLHHSFAPSSSNGLRVSEDAADGVAFSLPAFVSLNAP